MQVDIAGRVKNLQLPLTQSCVPLFECLVNSIEAIADTATDRGRIDVYFERDQTQGDLPSIDEGALPPIKTITVVDNGSGFNDANARAFLMSDSTSKASRGNKGIGRFTWLKVFERASIDSVFWDDGEWSRRTFDFVRTANGIERENVEPIASQDGATRTAVTLNNLRPEYQKHFPKSLETVGRKIIDHLLIHFVSGACPTIVLHDGEGSPVNLNEIFETEAEQRVQEVEFAVRNNGFRARVLRYHSSSARYHTVSYCANQREVFEWKASKRIPDMAVRFVDETGNPFVFKTYVSGPYLDARATAERTDFMFLQDRDIAFPEEMTREELDNAVVQVLLEVASPFVKALQQEKREAIQTFVQQKAPEFRHILHERHESRLESIPPNLSEDQLDIELYKVQRDIEVEHRQLAAKIKAPVPESSSGAEEYAALYDKYLNEENELGKAALAKYVVHRRTILEMLDGALKLQESGKYQREDFVHRLIYPMRKTSDEVEFEDQNLWVVDERLAYHWELASDLPMSRLKAVNATGGDEADLVVFNTPRAFTETHGPYQSIVIVEFKRPERNEYPQKEEDPVDQVLRYVGRIKDGMARDKDGKTINVGAVPFYAYILCSLTPRIRAIAESRDFVRTPDNEGYFQYHKNTGCYIEILSYDKVLQDARKRNRAFFERLQIPMN